MSLKIFNISSNSSYLGSLDKKLLTNWGSIFYQVFPDQEDYIRPDENVRSSDVYIISDLASDSELSASSKLWRLVQFVGACKDASAGRITAVCPYLSFSRQDRKTESRAPITTKYVAQTLEAVGLNRIMTMDVHNLSAFQNSFRIPTDNLEAKHLLVRNLLTSLCTLNVEDQINYMNREKEKPVYEENLVVLSPDAGGVSRARQFHKSAEKLLNKSIGFAYLDKRRSSGEKVDGSKIIGEVKDKFVVIYDDIISSASTIALCKEVIEAFGGTLLYVCATHGLFVKDAYKRLEGIRFISVTDSVNRGMSWMSSHTYNNQTFNIIDTTDLWARAINNNHKGLSISELLED